MAGPFSCLVVLFPGNKFTGEIAPGLTALERSGIIKVMDFVLVMKDGDGIVETRGAECLENEHREALGILSPGLDGWLSLEDVATIGAMVPRDGSAAVLLIENRWRSKLSETAADDHVHIMDDRCMPRKQVMQVLR